MLLSLIKHHKPPFLFGNQLIIQKYFNTDPLMEFHLFSNLNLLTINSIDDIFLLFGKNIKFVKIIKTEEKGSDVNLAVHLLNDARLNR